MLFIARWVISHLVVHTRKRAREAEKASCARSFLPPLPAFRQMIERFAVFYPSFAKRLNDIWNSVEDGYR